MSIHQPQTITVHAVDPRKGPSTLSGTMSGSLMEFLRGHDQSVMALCGGGMSCGTCHVHLAQPWADRIEPPSADETAILECCGDYVPGASRLSCQVRLTTELQGAVLTIVGA